MELELMRGEVGSKFRFMRGPALAAAYVVTGKLGLMLSLLTR